MSRRRRSSRSAINYCVVSRHTMFPRHPHCCTAPAERDRTDERVSAASVASEWFSRCHNMPKSFCERSFDEHQHNFHDGRSYSSSQSRFSQRHLHPAKTGEAFPLPWHHPDGAERPSMVLVSSQRSATRWSCVPHLAGMLPPIEHFKNYTRSSLLRSVAIFQRVNLFTAVYHRGGEIISRDLPP